jgi:hypothetical protein
MDTDDERDELTGDDELTSDDQGDDDDVSAYRARAASKLDQIAQDAKEALAEHGIGLSLFFVIPSNGQSILFFGTSADPSDDLWNEVTEIVSGIVQQLLGLRRPRCRTLLCAMADTAPVT